MSMLSSQKPLHFIPHVSFFNQDQVPVSALNFVSQNSVKSTICAHHAENNSLPFCMPAFVKGFSNAATPDDQNLPLASIRTVP